MAAFSLTMKANDVLDSTDFHCMGKNILQDIVFCAPQKKQSQTGLERHEGESVGYIFDELS